MDLGYYRETFDKHGLGAALYHAACRLANRVTRVAVWNGMDATHARLNRELLDDPHRAWGRMVDAESMRAYGADPALQLSPAFLDEAVRKGDRCYALFDGDVLASFGWYTRRPTRLLELDRSLELRFDPAYAYMYHGFTHPLYRGQRLHGVGMAAALELLSRDGCKGLVAYVDSSNFASLKSCARLGFETFGHLVLVRVGGRYACRATAGCRPFRFEVGPAVAGGPDGEGGPRPGLWAQ